MKIKFKITNSSSTSFIILWTSQHKQSLFKKLKREDCFNLKYDNFKCTTDDIIDDINFHWRDIVRDIDTEIEISKYRLIDMKGYKFYNENPEYILNEKKNLSILQKAKSDEFKNMILIDFGDNHGDVSGGMSGHTMDYEGRYINIKKEDLIIFTKQNR